MAKMAYRASVKIGNWTEDLRLDEVCFKIKPVTLTDT